MSERRDPLIVHKFRVNFRVLIVLASLAVVIGLSVYFAGEGQQKRMSRATMEAATKLYESGDADLAIRHLSQHLIAWPADVDALELKGRILYKTASSIEQIYDAGRLHEQLLRVAPDAPFSQDARRRLVELDVGYSDVMRDAQISTQFMNELYARNVRYRAAEEVARQLIERGGRKPSDYLLWARALDGMAVPGDSAALAGAVKQYQNVLAMTPDNVEAAERLAMLYQGRMKDPARAELVLNELIKAAPKSVKARLARHKLYVKLHLTDKAANELEAASGLDPTENEFLDLMIASAEFLLRKGDTQGARRQLARVSKKFENDKQAVLRMDMIRGLIDFEEEQPDDAIDVWRHGLEISMGTDADMTWWLAYALLQMNRVQESAPLFLQYQRLLSPSDPRFQFLEAVLFERTGRPALALSLLESINQRLDPRYMGMVELARGRCAEALWAETKARDAYGKALEIDPGSVVARLALAKLKLRRSPEDAISEIENGLKIDPENPALRIAMVGARLRAEAAKPAGRRFWEQFDRDWRAALDRSPGNSALALLWADRLSLDKREEEAIKFLEETAAKSPRSAAVAIALANGFNRLGKYDKALEALDRAKAPGATGDQASLRITRAITLTALFRGRDAREALTANIDQLPKSEQTQVWMTAGQFDADRGDLDAAQQDYFQAGTLNPGDPRPLLVLLELALGRDDRATIRVIVKRLFDDVRRSGRIANEESAKQTAKSDLTYMIARAKELLWLTKEPNLIEALLADVELDELNDAEIAKKRSELVAMTTKLSDAEKSAKLEESKALKIAKAARLIDAIVFEAPELPAAQMLKAGVLELQGDYDNAIASYIKVWERGNEIALPKIMNLLKNRRRYDTITQLWNNPAASKSQVDLFSAQIFLQVGDRRQAGRMAEQLALDLNNSNEALGFKAKMLDHLGRIDDAENVFRALAERQPQNTEPWLALIRFQAESKRKQALAETVTRAKAAIKSDRPETLEARILWAAGDVRGASKAFAEAAGKYPEDLTTRLEAARFHEENHDLDTAESYLRQAGKIAPNDRRVVRQLAEVLSARALRAGKAELWREAWDILGPEGEEKLAPPEDRLARAVVLYRTPDGVEIPKSEGATPVSASITPRGQAIQRLENLVRDLPLNQSAPARKTLAAWLMEPRSLENVGSNTSPAGESKSKDGTSADRIKGELTHAEREKLAEQAIQPIAAAGTDPTAIALYAQVLIQSKRIDAAEWQLDRLAALSPGDPREANLRARLIFNRSQPVEAARALEQAYTNREDDPGSESLGREAFVILAQVAPRDPSVLRLAQRLSAKNPACAWMPAQIQAIRGSYDDAFENLKTATKSATRFDDLVETGKVASTIVFSSPDKVTINKAEEILKTLLKTEPDADVLNIMMAMLKHVQGDYEEEVRLYDKALERRPEDYTILNNLAWALCEGLHRYNEAITYADTLVTLYGQKDPRVKDTRGVILTRLGKKDPSKLAMAIEDLEIVVREDPAPLHKLHLARAYELYGKIEESRKLRDSARVSGLTPRDIDPAEREEILEMLKP